MDTRKITIVTEFPPGWDERRVRRVLDYYENQPDDEATAEATAALAADERAGQNEPETSLCLDE